MVPEPNELTVVKKPSKKSKKVKKEPCVLTVLSLIFTILSIPCAFSGLILFQVFFILLAFILYVVDRKKNGKRGVSLFGMVCTLATFIIIFITLVYSVLLLGIGIYTVYINPEPYNLVSGAIKNVISWVLSLFGINISF